MSLEHYVSSTGITVEKLGEVMKVLSKAMNKITKKSIERVSAEREVSLEEAEKIYFAGLRNRTLNVDGSKIQ